MKLALLTLKYTICTTVGIILFIGVIIGLAKLLATSPAIFLSLVVLGVIVFLAYLQAREDLHGYHDDDYL